jgi:hypothetical protein
MGINKGLSFDRKGVDKNIPPSKKIYFCEKI